MSKKKIAYTRNRITRNRFFILIYFLEIRIRTFTRNWVKLLGDQQIIYSYVFLLETGKLFLSLLNMVFAITEGNTTLSLQFNMLQEWKWNLGWQHCKSEWKWYAGWVFIFCEINPYWFIDLQIQIYASRRDLFLFREQVYKNTLSVAKAPWTPVCKSSKELSECL